MSRSGFRPSGRTLPAVFEVRPPTDEDRPDLASLMMSAYVGTIDYDGQTFEQAVEEVDGYFERESLLAESRLAARAGIIDSAILVSLVEADALIGYLMTRADDKNRGLASALLDRSVEEIWESGHEKVRCFITDGNAPSERIFTKAGFEVVRTIGAD